MVLKHLVLLCVISLPVYAFSEEIAEKSSQHQPGNEEEFAKGELIVRFKSGVAKHEVEEISKSLNCKIIKQISKANNIYLIQLPKGEFPDKFVEVFSGIANVQYAEPNYIQRQR